MKVSTDRFTQDCVNKALRSQSEQILIWIMKKKGLSFKEQDEYTNKYLKEEVKQ